MSKKSKGDVNYSKRNCTLTVVAIILYAMTVVLSAGLLAVSLRECEPSDSSSAIVPDLDELSFESFCEDCFCL